MNERDPLLDEISATLTVEPSPPFVGRVRAEVASERMGWPWRAHLLVAVPVVLALTIAGAAWLNREATPRLPASVPVLTTAKGSLPATARTPAPARSAPARVTSGRTAPMRVDPLREPEVLIAPDQAEGLRRWMTWVREGRAVPPAGWPAVNDETGELLPLPEIAAIEVPAVTIDPLPGSTGGDDAQTIGVDD